MVGARGSKVEAIWLRGADSNRRPSGYEPDELPLLHPATGHGKATTLKRQMRLTDASSRGVAGMPPRIDGPAMTSPIARVTRIAPAHR